MLVNRMIAVRPPCEDLAHIQTHLLTDRSNGASVTDGPDAQIELRDYARLLGW